MPDSVTLAPQKQPTEAPPCRIRRVCFVCTGNTCRSPMAAAVYNHLHRGEPTHAVSRGVAAHPGHPIHPYAVEALRKAGVPSTPGNDYEHHLSALMDEETAKWADELICLSSSHAMTLCCAYPAHAEKIRVLGELADPWGGTQEDYDRALAEIREALQR